MNTIGITSYGAYIPTARLPLALLDGAQPRVGGPEKAVAGFDEDAITMAVAACGDCFPTFERSRVDALFFITTSSPFAEKQGAAQIARALDLRPDVLTADMGTSLRGAGAALAAALDMVRADPAKTVLVVAADCRLAPPHSALERNLGDAAVALLIGADAALVCEQDVAASDTLFDIWRAAGDATLHSWEDRFNITEGYQRNTAQVLRRLLEKTGTSAPQYRAVACYGPDARSHRALLTELGFSRAQIVDPLFGRVGNCGAAHALLLLASQLHALVPADRVLLGFYGDGAHAFALRCDKPMPRPPRDVSWYLERGRTLPDYDSYLVSRQLDTAAAERRGGDGVAATVHYREREATTAFIGARCRVCGTGHFPPTRVCYRCYSKDDFEPLRLSDREGTLLSYTLDYFFPSPQPPVAAGMCAVAGARVYLQLTDVEPDQLRCDLPLEFVFRKIHDAGGRPNYFWKATPARAPREVSHG